MGGGPPKVLTINDPDSLNNDAGVTSVAISPDGRWVAAGSLDTVVRIWDVSTGQLVERLRGHRDSVYSVAFTPDGKGLVSGSLDKTLKYWDVSGLNGSSGSGSANGSVKGKKEGSQAPNGGPSGPGASGAVVKKDEKGGRVSECTMNFIGHKVSFHSIHQYTSNLNSPAPVSNRTTSSPSPSHTTASGSSPAPKTGAYNSGTHARRSCSVCCRDTRTVSSLSISVPQGMYWLQAAGIGKPGYGVMGVFRVLMNLKTCDDYYPTITVTEYPTSTSSSFPLLALLVFLFSAPPPAISFPNQDHQLTRNHHLLLIFLLSSPVAVAVLIPIPIPAYLRPRSFPSFFSLHCCRCLLLLPAAVVFFLLVCFHSYQLKMLPSLISCYMFV